MADEKDANGGAWSRVPTWDGSPQTWRPFRREMAWWLAGLDVQSTKKYNLAARWLLRQSGVVRQRGEEFDPSELEYKRAVMMPNPATGDDEEAEVLTAELEEAAACGLDQETLQEVEDSVEAAAEAFLTMKEARSKLQEVKKDRGYGKPAAAPSTSASRVSLKKQSDKHPCYCGLPGHWAGDPECQKPGQQLGRKKPRSPTKQVKMAEALNTEHEDVTVDNEVMVEDENETFRFGNGGTQQSFQRWRLPTMIGGEVVCFWTSVVQVPSLGLLLGRDFLEAVGAVMNFGRKSLRCELLDDNSIKLSQLAAGHYALGLLPSAWPSLEPQRWRRLGLDGVIEIQLSTTSWLKKRLNQSLLCRTCYLRYLPLPYPATASVKFWEEEQAKSQAKDGIISKKHLARAKKEQKFTYLNLNECVQWRNRMGLETSFCEGPILKGIQCGKSARGLAERLKKAALEEAEAKAREAHQRGEEEEQARALIGPRGGLPTLRTDLIRLAALLRVPLGPKRPIVEILKNTKPAAKPSAKAKMKGLKVVKQEAASSSLGKSSDPGEEMITMRQYWEMQARFQVTLDNLALEMQELRGGRLPEHMTDFTTVLTEPVWNPVYKTSRRPSLQDADMEEPEMMTEEEMRQESAHTLEQVWEAKLAAQYGEDYYLLTQEEMSAVLIRQIE
ncbi:unnamed protein product [Durusdinium trenchii]|uniref:Uncharacterized protein n=1 Tax=Durusdinium trenchii TaxID=1381693 RepID=A0ABP0MSF6_9DINO